jgi:hypothetical protein
MACAGYHLQQNANPFQEHQVRTVAIPLMINHTALPLLGVYVTDKISEVLRSYPHLKVYPGEKSSVDAILIGELTAPVRGHDFWHKDQQVFTGKEFEGALGRRRPFYVASDLSYQVKLRLILLKVGGVDEGGKMVQGRYGKVIFDQTLPLRGSLAQQTDANMTANGRGDLNFVRNKALLELSQQQVAEKAAQDFQQLVLDVF